MLAHTHNIASEKRTAFQARLKNLLKLGLLPQVTSGRGKAATYSPWDLILLAITLELSQLGLTPARALLVIQINQRNIATVVWNAADAGPPRDGKLPFPMLLSFDPRGLAELELNSTGDVAARSFRWSALGNLQPQLNEWFPQGLRRLSIINVSALIYDVASYAGIGRVAEFYRAAAECAELACYESGGHE